MLRSKIMLALVLSCLLAPLKSSAQEAAVPAAEAQARKLGFYFGMSLEKLSQLGQANGLGVIVDPPAVLGGNFSVAGPEVDGDLRSRWALGFKLGFRLRKDHGSVEGRYFQWDEQEDLFREAGDGKAIANTLASPLAGFSEDLGLEFFPGGPDGRATHFEAGTLSEGSEPADPVADGAEDLNYNGRPDFIRFATSDRIVGELKTDFQIMDVDYVRQLKQLRRLTLDGRVGIRAVSVHQVTDLGYRDLGAFAAYSDDEGASRVSERTSTAPGCGNSTVVDGDGDGERTTAQNEPDGDGFMDGNCNSRINDQIESVETVTEDRIIADIKATGIGLHVGVDGRFDLSKKWRLSGGIGVALLAGETEFRYRETFTSERDRYPNFIEWDLNGDGLYDNRDLDFDGSCADRPPELCTPDTADQAALPFLDATLNRRYLLQPLMRSGVNYSYVSPRIFSPGPLQQPLGVNADAFTGTGTGRIRVGDPIPESERNRDILRESTLLEDVSGNASGLQPMLDLNVGLEYQFSKFAHFDFGVRSTRWFGAGSFRSVANQVVADDEVKADDGDFSLTGMYFTITIVPR
jgi:hypothetical protein